MTTFRARAARWHAVISFSLILVFTIGLAISVFVNLKRSQRAILKGVIHAIEKELEADGSPVKDLAPLNQQLTVFSNSDVLNLGYAIIGPNGEVVAQSRTPSELEKATRSRGADKTTWISHNSYKNWTFYRAKTIRSHRVIASSTRQFDFIDHTLLALAVMLPLLLAVSVFAGNVVARKTLAPLDAIGATASKIDNGDTSARIDASESDSEMTALIHTLNETFDRQQENVTRIEQFSADAAHQLKTPLAAIRANLEVCLRDERSNAFYIEAIAVALEEIHSLQKLVEALLLIERPTNDKELRSQFCRLNARETIQQSTELLETVAALRGITLTLNVDDDFYVSGLAVFLPHLWHNLVHNAIKYSPDDGTVFIDAIRMDSDLIEIRIRDQGPGVNLAERDRLFERFRQAKGSAKGGTGLGLAVAKWIVELHGGTIAMESDNGATVIVGLPLAQPTPAKAS